jgi:hypothetical protein
MRMNKEKPIVGSRARILLVISLLLVSACNAKRSEVGNDDYQISVTNLITEKTDELRLGALGKRHETHRISGDVSVFKNGKPSANGLLSLRYSETTGFNKWGDRPFEAMVPIIDGKGELELELRNMDLPIDQASSPPKIAIKDSFFKPMARVVAGDGKTSASPDLNEPVVMFSVKPISVVQSGGSYVATEEIDVKGLGSLEDKTFGLWVVRDTVESSTSSRYLSRTQLFSIIVYGGSAKHRSEDFLTLVNSLTDSENEKAAPEAPKFKYRLVGIEEGALVKVVD